MEDPLSFVLDGCVVRYLEQHIAAMSPRVGPAE
jgi:hypothetical protein